MEVEDESGLSEENGIGNADGLGALFGHAQAQCRLQIQLELATAADGYGLIESPITLELRMLLRLGEVFFRWFLLKRNPSTY
jgi:hypothetical protein